MLVSTGTMSSGSSGSIGNPSMAPRPYPNTSGSMHAMLSMMPLMHQGCKLFHHKLDDHIKQTCMARRPGQLPAPPALHERS